MCEYDGHIAEIRYAERKSKLLHVLARSSTSEQLEMKVMSGMRKNGRRTMNGFEGQAK